MSSSERTPTTYSPPRKREREPLYTLHPCCYGGPNKRRVAILAKRATRTILLLWIWAYEERVSYNNSGTDVNINDGLLCLHLPNNESDMRPYGCPREDKEKNNSETRPIGPEIRVSL